MGICSRREADRYVEEGRITVNGRPAELGQKITEADELLLDGKKIGPEQKDAPVLIAFNKPRGIVCTTSSKDRATNIIEFIDYPVRIFPIGRLDKESEGIILLTNQGELVNLINRQRYGHEKEYIVRVVNSDGSSPTLSQEQLKLLNFGLSLDGKPLLPAQVSWLNDDELRFILKEGKKRQIRRMCEAVGLKVLRLKRVRVGRVVLGNLPVGQWRYLKPDEYF